MFARSVFRSAAPLKQVRLGIWPLCSTTILSLTRRAHPLRTQCARSYATGAPSGSSSRSSAGAGAAAAAAAVVAAGLGGYGFLSSPPGARAEALDSAHGASKKAFTGGDQGFVSLKLDSVETINHNVKRFRFALPESDMESGLAVACASSCTSLSPPILLFAPRLCTLGRGGNTVAVLC